MSKSQPSVQNRKFLALASLIIVLSAGLAASAWPAVLSYGRDQSTKLSMAGTRTDREESRLNFQLAYLLNPGNQVAALSVAATQQEAGEQGRALKTLKNAGQNRGVDRVKAKAALETGDIKTAVAAAERLAEQGAPDNDLILASLAYGVAGKPERIEPLKARVTSPEALQGVLRAGGSKLTLAVGLRATGLLISSRGILEQAEVSVPRNLLLATLIKTDGRAADLPQLAKLYREEIALDPSGTAARDNLIGVLRAQKDDVAAGLEQKLLDRLKAGRP